ncbi:hypothetical protein [Bradyrhizobium sp. 6(2017)]|uniref:hypothetical protein n=1 Tax=Bradyrhizobium sp. 6(2017) TaxID=1197460 RepID=UPI0013E15301|nr:hypothetical protein [Bradyrhizobium sp. 6(2017)]QIG94125.1 hypothetical protein G6P99_17615 [Bradyrhizobium sp. 6(2017)]
MRRIAILAVSAAINASTVPSLAAECTSIKEIDASRSCSELLRSQPAKLDSVINAFNDLLATRCGG